jgi:hypothetical protein
MRAARIRVSANVRKRPIGLTMRGRLTLGLMYGAIGC